MLMCQEQVTLVHLERTDDGETYVLTPISGVSWYGKRIVTQTTKGIQGQNAFQSVFKVRVPENNMPCGVVPCRGDFIVRGEVRDVKKAPADFADREYFCIASIGDNRRGRLRHWLIGGA